MPNELFWAPPRSKGAAWFTRTWRIIAYHPGHEPAPALYIALFPESLASGYELAFPVLEEWQVDHRHARDAAILEAYSGHRAWAGKAVVVGEPGGRPLEGLVQRLDAVLAGRGLTGPSAIEGARPYGGSSGLLFLCREIAAAPPPMPVGDQRRQRLSQLLNT